MDNLRFLRPLTLDDSLKDLQCLVNPASCTFMLCLHLYLLIHELFPPGQEVLLKLIGVLWSVVIALSCYLCGIFGEKVTAADYLSQVIYVALPLSKSAPSM